MIVWNFFWKNWFFLTNLFFLENLIFLPTIFIGSNWFFLKIFIFFWHIFFSEKNYFFSQKFTVLIFNVFFFSNKKPKFLLPNIPKRLLMLFKNYHRPYFETKKIEKVFGKNWQIFSNPKIRMSGYPEENKNVKNYIYQTGT